MASGSDDSRPHHQEKWSKKNNDPTGSSKPSGRTKEACPHVATGARGHGRGTRACGAQPSSQALADPPPRVGAVTVEFVPGSGNVPVVDLAKEALNQASRTITTDVCTMTLPSSPCYFGVSCLVPFPGPLPTIREPHQIQLVVTSRI